MHTLKRYSQHIDEDSFAALSVQALNREQSWPSIPALTLISLVALGTLFTILSLDFFFICKR